ncbi:MAG TPA: rRNA maturation RNase YbeY [Acidisarcina sp.]|nr:rRNA maturation RNase YbeY [Acidisarcina sp.]
MIVIEPANLLASLAAASGTSSGRTAPLGRRELSSFLGLAAEGVGVKGQISVLLTDDRTIRELNRQFRKKDKATDVLSFPAAEPVSSGRKTALLAGDLAVSLETAARQARAFGHTLQTEVKVLLLHGLLHLAGLDHETDSGQMARRESSLRKRFGLPLGLIQRSGEATKKPVARKAAPVKTRTAKKSAPRKRATRTAPPAKRSKQP